MDARSHRSASSAPARLSRSQRGGTLVFVLVLVAVGGLGLMGGLSLLQTVSRASEAQAAEVTRQLRLANSGALAREVIRRKYSAAAKGPDKAETISLPGGWGAVTISPWSGAPLAERDATRYHHGGAAPWRAFSKDLEISLSDGSASFPWKAQVRSVHPGLAGDLLVMHLPTLSPTVANEMKGAALVKGRGVFWTGGGLHKVSIRCDRYVIPDPAAAKMLLADSSGTAQPPENALFLPVTAGIIGGASDYSGKLNVVNNTASPHHSYVHRFGVNGTERQAVGVDGTKKSEGGVDEDGNGIPSFRSEGNGDIYVDLDEPSLGFLHVTTGVKRLFLYGQESDQEFAAAADLPPAVIVVENPAASSQRLERIELRGRNNRRVILAVKAGRVREPVELRFEGDVEFPRWRGIWELENVNLRVEVRGKAKAAYFRGGLRTDRGMDVRRGELIFERENDPGPLEILACRQGWIETYRP